MTYPVSIIAQVNGASPDLSEGQLRRLAAFYKLNDGKTVQITVRETGKPRSNNQNRYYWSICVGMIADETGHTAEEVHEFLKAKLLPRYTVTIASESISATKSTSDLSTDQFETFLNHVRAFAAIELGLTIPLPNESVY